MPTLVGRRVAELAVDLQLARVQPMRIVNWLLRCVSLLMVRQPPRRHAVHQSDQAKKQASQEYDGDDSLLHGRGSIFNI
jgi:hypothetical protein